MAKEALDKAHPVELVKQFMDDKGAYLGTTEVLVGVSIPCPDAVLSALPTPDDPLIESPRAPSRTRSPSLTPLLGKRSRSLTPLLVRGRSLTPLLVRGRSLTPLLERGRSPTPLLERARGAVRLPVWYTADLSDVFSKPPVYIPRRE